MKIAIISDTHDELIAVKKFVEIFREKNVNYLIHAGDIVSPFVIDIFSKLDVPQKYVFGNNDGEKIFLMEKISKIGTISKGPTSFEIDGREIVLMHEPFAIKTLLKSGKYKMIIYGHTHKIHLEKEGNSIVINPGEACGYLTGTKSSVIIDTKSFEIEKITL